MRESYIGICDFDTERRTKEMCDFYFQIRGPDSGRLLMVGLMVYRETMLGLPHAHVGIAPKNEDVRKIFVPDRWALNTLHYADYAGIDVEPCLEQATVLGGPFMDAIQLDMIWPDPSVLRAYRARHPNVRVVLQVGHDALEQVGNRPDALLKRLEPYGDSLDDVLLDKSMGRGLGLDAEFMRPFVVALDRHRPDLGITLAGGLGPDSLDLVAPLMRECPRISIDAQGRLRAGGAAQPINWDYARAYLARAVRRFGPHARQP